MPSRFQLPLNSAPERQKESLANYLVRSCLEVDYNLKVSDEKLRELGASLYEDEINHVNFSKINLFSFNSVE